MTSLDLSDDDDGVYDAIFAYCVLLSDYLLVHLTCYCLLSILLVVQSSKNLGIRDPFITSPQL